MKRQWMTLPARIVGEQGTLCLPEGPGANIDDVLTRLRNGTYDRPFVIDDDRFRRLHFGLRFVQSEMTVADPDRLNFAYTQMMMAFMLFRPRFRHVVLVGLGGGSLTRYCYRHLPATRLTTIEISQDVIDLGEWFGLPPDDGRHELIHGDALTYFATTEDRPDAVLVDACDGAGVAAALTDPQFFADVRRCLAEDGVLAVNLIGKARDVQGHLQTIADVFGGGVLTHMLRRDGNRLAFVVNREGYLPDWTAIQRRASMLTQTQDLDFPAFARKLRRGRVIDVDGG